MEIEQLRKRLADSEMKSARVAHDVRQTALAICVF
jgi:hypothetical protein